MFERYTDRARRVLVLAKEEARLLNHNYIGTEHVLMGLLHEGDGIAAEALTNLGVQLDAVRESIEDIIGVGGTKMGGSIPFTPRTKKVLELALSEALRLGHSYVGTEHLLLALVREGEGVAANVLGKYGITLPIARSQVVQLLSAQFAEANVRLPVPAPEPRSVQPPVAPEEKWYLIEYIGANGQPVSATINSPEGWKVSNATAPDPFLHIGGHAFTRDRVISILRVDKPPFNNTVTPAGMKSPDEKIERKSSPFLRGDGTVGNPYVPYVIHEVEVPPSQMTLAQRTAAVQDALDAARQADPSYIPPETSYIPQEKWIRSNPDEERKRKEAEKERKRKWGDGMGRAISQARAAMERSCLNSGIVYIPRDGSAPSYIYPNVKGLDRLEEIFAEYEEVLDDGPEYP